METFVIDLKEKHIWLGLMRDSMDIKKVFTLLHHGYLKKQAALKFDALM